MNFVKALLPMLLTVIIILFVYNILKIYVLDKIKINKWIVLFIAALVFLIPSFIWGQKLVRSYWQYLQTGVFLIFFLWFMDLAGLNKKRTVIDKNNNYTIKAKAKPNRVHNSDMDIVSDKKKRKKKNK